VCDREAGDLAAAVDAVIAAGGRSIAFSPGPHVTDVGITDGNIGDFRERTGWRRLVPLLS
jgi:hypothetical protein